MTSGPLGPDIKTRCPLLFVISYPGMYNLFGYHYTRTSPFSFRRPKGSGFPNTGHVISPVQASEIFFQQTLGTQTLGAPYSSTNPASPAATIQENDPTCLSTKLRRLKRDNRRTPMHIHPSKMREETKKNREREKKCQRKSNRGAQLCGNRSEYGIVS